MIVFPNLLCNLCENTESEQWGLISELRKIVTILNILKEQCISLNGDFFFSPIIFKHVPFFLAMNKQGSRTNWHPLKSLLTKPELEAVIWWVIQGEVISKMRIVKVVYCVICSQGLQATYPGTYYLLIVLELRCEHFCGKSVNICTTPCRYFHILLPPFYSLLFIRRNMSHLKVRFCNWVLQQIFFLGGELLERKDVRTQWVNILFKPSLLGKSAHFIHHRFFM